MYSKLRDLDLDKRALYPHVDYPYHPSLTYHFFKGLGDYLRSPESVDLSYRLLKKFFKDVK